MKRRKVMPVGNRIFLFFIQQVIAVICAACITTVALSSIVQGERGFEQYNFFITPLEYGDADFTESDIFNSVLVKGVRDIVRMSVIKSQLETNGEFDPNKVIDVTSYVNRAEKLSGLYVTASYRLEDLLKWGKYGFEYTGKVFESVEEMNQFLAPETAYTFYEGSYVTGFLPENGDKIKLSVDEATDSVNFAVVESEEVKEEVNNAEAETYQTILTSRYKTIDGKTPQEIVSTWEEYYELCNNISEAASSLYYNYREYLDYEDFYSRENSNLLYCMEMLVDGKNVFFTNVDLESFIKKGTIQEFFDQFDKKIYYSPYDMDYDTNTGIQEEYFLQLMNEYGYAYNENTKIWIVLDDSYQADDIFAKVNYVYNTVLPHWWQYVGIALVCMVLYALITILLSTFTGRRETEDGEEKKIEICVTRFEKIPTEIWLLLSGVIVLLLAIMVWFTFDMLLWKIKWTKVEERFVVKVVAIETAIVSSILGLLFYSFVRKCKVHTFWKGSFTYRLYKCFYKHILCRGARAVKMLYGNLPIVLRSLLPYVFIIGMNVFSVFFIVVGLEAEVGILFLGILFMADAAIGWAIFKNSVDKQKIIDGIGEIRDGDLNYQVDTQALYGDNRILAEAVNSIGDGIRLAVETSMKDERLKADLITNVSHDIKTPLTSIINYVDLLKREDIQDEKIKNYIQVLDSKSQRLKQLTDDLVEASKISSGNITLHIERINIVELLNQAIGEFSEKFDAKDLQMVVTFEKKAMYIDADSRRMWRVIENLFNNIYKYALTGTRVYVDVREVQDEKETDVVLTVKNISEQPLNINADELTERFIRGDVSRSTEGSGLGLSIAKNLTEAQNGKFNIYLDGDLFKAMLRFKKAEQMPE